MPEFSTQVAESRTQRCSINLVAASVFRESARLAHEEAGTHTLACISYYYSAFHIAVSALWITETVDHRSLRQVHHNTLRKLVAQHLKQTKRIKAAFMSDYLHLQELREESNYHFFFSPKHHDYSQLAGGLYGRTEAMMDCIVPNIRNRLNMLGTLSQLQMYIGDGIGDDLIDTHGSPKVRRAALQYLTDQGLTT